MSAKSIFPVTLNWVESEAGNIIPVVYDNHVELVDEFNAYLQSIAKEKLEALPSDQSYKSEIELHAYAIKSFLTYLCDHGLDWKIIDDDELVAIRDWMLSVTINDPKSKGDANPAMRTTNRKLRVIYNYLVWAQDSIGYIEDRIGLGDAYPINSILPLSQRNANIKKNDARMYPKCFRKCGEGSRSRYQYSATSEDKAKLIGYFSDDPSEPYVAERNILIMELADQVGWRNSSINSLTVDQFSDDSINNADQYSISVTPLIQKLGYEYSFDVPLALANRINQHVKTGRANFIRNKFRNPGKASDALFLSMKSGQGLGIKTIVQIFSVAMKEIGCPRGSGIHSFRRKFAQDISDSEVAFRRAHKLSLASEDTSLVVSRKLGQASATSQETYIKSMAVQSEKTLEAKLIRENNAMANELANAKLENARLLKMIEHLEQESEL